MEILHLQHHEINKELWDQTIRDSINGNIYVWSWYLDAVCPGWQALLTEDYRIVMPLTMRRKYGINYLYQPLLSQQAGVVSKDSLKTETVDGFLRAIPKKYKLAEITLNPANNPTPGIFAVSSHKTFLLDLNHSYEELHRAYSENNRRNLRKALTSNPDFQTNCPPGEFLDLLMQDNSQGNKILLSPKNKPVFIGLLNAILENHSGNISGLRNSQGNLIAAALTGVSHKKIYYLVPAINKEGRDSRAMFYLIDRIIRSFAGQDLLLDFEGSDIENVARFYNGFGSSPLTYPAIRFNHLPLPLKILAGRRSG